MSGLNASMGSASGDVLDAGFAKLQGKNFNYIMQSYEITMGRSTKKEKVDLGGVWLPAAPCHGKDVTRHSSLGRLWLPPKVRLARRAVYFAVDFSPHSVALLFNGTLCGAP